MFTGLIQAMGRIARRSGGKLIVKPDVPPEDPVRGESIAVNGCCLTLERASAEGLEFHTLAESLRRTNLGTLPIGAAVNLERALRPGDRMGGHIVQGHVDTAAEVLECRRLADGDFALTVALPPAFAALVTEKGSVAVDGVSLTVAEAGRDRFSVRLIPVTLEETALRDRRPGTPVNLEFDIIGRYVARMLEMRGDLPSSETESGITLEKLREAGFL